MTATTSKANTPSPGTSFANLSDRMTARIVGALILLATTTYMIGSGLLESIFSSADFLLQVEANRSQVVTGVLLEFVNATAIAAVGILMFPILRRYSQAIALGYAGTRIIECTLLIVAGISSLLLIPLSQQAIQMGTADTASLMSMATLLLTQSDLAFQFAMVALGVGSIPFCYLLFRTKLVPRPIALLGIIGYPLLIINGVLVAFGNDVGIWLFLVGAVFELAFPIWIIVKGFNTSPLPVQVAASS